ncbi:hypothetical protein OIU79_010430 [Salix purpurea]|uniref:Uncharacterized protein n=1 Tax=Salix purpurea TaxID=77065 RepID=A0A9Q0QFI6_SALPP|nr:hypothetical protein OIU79_010430 [Salix purpurea]
MPIKPKTGKHDIKRENKSKCSEVTEIHIARMDLCTLESIWDFLPAIVEQQLQGNRNVQVNAQDVGFDGGAKTNSSFEIGKITEKAAARALWGGTNDDVHQIQQICANTQFQGVLRASFYWLGLVFMAFWL